MNKALYADNYPVRRQEAFLRAAGQCEHLLNGERCKVRLGDWRVTRSKQLQFEQLICHHVNGDPENPEAELLIICWACHMRLHRKPGPGRKKASARKQGYEVIRIPHLLSLLTCAGFHTWTLPSGSTGWQIGPFQSEAHDPVDAIVMALHWLEAEVRDLQEKLQAREEVAAYA
jgi:hypothetical protein